MFRNETQKMIYKNPVTLLTGYRMRNEYFMWCEFLVTCYWHHSASVKYWFSVRIATYKMKCINDDDDRTFYQRPAILCIALLVNRDVQNDGELYNHYKLWLSHEYSTHNLWVTSREKK